MPSYTRKQTEVLELIAEAMREQGMAPTLEEIAQEMGVSRVTVFQHLRALERKGAIRRQARHSRAIEILDPAFRPTRGLPLAGTIAAGEPILAIEDPEEISLEEFLGVDRAPGGCYLLRVRGDSMIEDHITDGDLVLIEARKTARNGEVVVAVIEEEATLKRYYRHNGRIRLQPANEGLRARTVDPRKTQIEIRGVVRGLIRRI
ncbi:MAG: transcriptional repressor LexA [Planctomycetota bacterium]